MIEEIFFLGEIVTAENLRLKRAEAGISGQSVCQVCGEGMSRAKLSASECGSIIATESEFGRMSDAIDLILRSRHALSELAAVAGLSLVGLRL
jgi:hypothetical protein